MSWHILPLFVLILTQLALRSLLEPRFHLLWKLIFVSYEQQRSSRPLQVMLLLIDLLLGPLVLDFVVVVVDDVVAEMLAVMVDEALAVVMEVNCAYASTVVYRVIFSDNVLKLLPPMLSRILLILAADPYK